MALDSYPGLRTLTQAAEYLAISARTLRNWRSLGLGPQALKVGSLVRYRQGELDAWLEAENSGVEGGAR